MLCLSACSIAAAEGMVVKDFVHRVSATCLAMLPRQWRVPTLSSHKILITRTNMHNLGANGWGLFPPPRSLPAPPQPGAQHMLLLYQTPLLLPFKPWFILACIVIASPFQAAYSVGCFFSSELMHPCSPPAPALPSSQDSLLEDAGVELPAISVL